MKSAASVSVHRFSKQGIREENDWLAVEEPLEIRLDFGPTGLRQQKSISITMRTPGDDRELATGFLFTEGIIQNIQQIQDITHLPAYSPEETDNIILVKLDESATVDLNRLERNFYTSSSCGVCGKASIAAVKTCSNVQLPVGRPTFAEALIHQLPHQLRQQQALFEHTGGLHAAALFDPEGQLLLLREDVGRHNAVDKLIGAALFEGWVPLQNQLILVSGRASFELVQKALMAGIPLLAAVGAPSSLAVQLAKDSGMSVLGFVRNDRFNIYSGAERIVATRPITK
ncbi:MAG: formate dehydrogenase accessory sulfurtransferase FdhD [Bacteroidota bacterium]